MAIQVSAKNYSLINACENAGDWTGETPSDVNDFYKEGSQCVGFTFRGIGSNDSYITGSWDLSGTLHFRAWFMTVILKELDTEANGGVQIFMSDGTNTGYWTVLGGDTYPGGWYNIVLDLSRNVDAGTKPDMSAITQIGFRLNLTALGKNAQNTWIDHLHISDGLIAYGDDAGEPFNLEDILSKDEDTTNGWGIIRRFGGIYFLAGDLTLGNDGGTWSCYFTEKGQILIFEDKKVNQALYGLRIVGNTIAITSVEFGEELGGVGINGVNFDVAGTILSYEIEVTDPDINTLQILGCIFSDSGTLDVGGSTIASFQNVSFNACAEVQGGTAIFDGCQFNNAPEAAFHMETDTGMGTCSFNANSIAISFAGAPDGTTFTLDELTFIGNGFDLYWDGSAGQTLTVINVDSNAASQKCPNGGTIDVQTGVWLKIYVDDEAGNPLDGVQCAIYTDPGLVQLMNEPSVSGLAQESYNYQGDQAVTVRARKQGYIPVYQEVTITSTGLTVYVTMYEDLAYSPT